MSTILIDQRNSYIHIKLNRPDSKNAMNPELIQELTQYFRDLNKQSHIRFVVLSGEGSSFCSGADLNWMKQSLHLSQEENKQDAKKLDSLFSSMVECPLPILSFVHGAVYGGALGLLAASDIVVSSSGTKFCFSEVRLGIAPAVISAYILKKCSPSLVSPWMLSGKEFSESEAKSMGLVTDIAPSPTDWVASLEMAGPMALRALKAHINQWAVMPKVEFHERSIELIANLRVSQEGQEGLSSFFEKRSPSWRVLK